MPPFTALAALKHPVLKILLMFICVSCWAICSISYGCAQCGDTQANTWGFSLTNVVKECGSAWNLAVGAASQRSSVSGDVFFSTGFSRCCIINKEGLQVSSVFSIESII